MAATLPPSYANSTPPPAMLAKGLDWFSVQKYGQYAIDTLKKVGNVATEVGDVILETVRLGFVAWEALAARDFSGILDSFKQGISNVEGIVAAIKSEFGIE